MFGFVICSSLMVSWVEGYFKVKIKQRLQDLTQLIDKLLFCFAFKLLLALKQKKCMQASTLHVQSLSFSLDFVMILMEMFF